MPGITTVGTEVTNAAGHGIGMLIDNEELAPHSSVFLWLKAATIQQSLNATATDGRPSRLA